MSDTALVLEDVVDAHASLHSLEAIRYRPAIHQGPPPPTLPLPEFCKGRTRSILFRKIPVGPSAEC